jgi:hypothetical protein
MTFMPQDEEKETEFPLSPGAIAEEQRKGEVLRKKPVAQGCGTGVTEGIEVTTCNDKICVPKSLETRVMAWCHEHPAHPGMPGAEEAIHQVSTWPGLGAQVKKFCRACGQCQVAKKPHRRHGHPPPREADTDPWKRVNGGCSDGNTSSSSSSTGEEENGAKEQQQQGLLKLVEQKITNFSNGNQGSRRSDCQQCHQHRNGHNNHQNAITEHAVPQEHTTISEGDPQCRQRTVNGRRRTDLMGNLLLQSLGANCSHEASGTQVP